jgi:hypothetical protein
MCAVSVELHHRLTLLRAYAEAPSNDERLSLMLVLQYEAPHLAREYVNQQEQVAATLQ